MAKASLAVTENVGFENIQDMTGHMSPFSDSIFFKIQEMTKNMFTVMNITMSKLPYILDL